MSIERRTGRLTTLNLGLLCLAMGFAAGCDDSGVPQGAYASYGLLRVSMNPMHVAFDSEAPATSEEFEVYKRTQAELVKSSFVITSALRDPKVSQLRIDKRESDPVAWATGQVHVDFPGDAEIMRVSFTCGDANEAQTMADAIIEAYMIEVIDAERNQQRDRLNKLDLVYSEKEQEVRTLARSLKNLSDTLGVDEQSGIKQQVAAQNLLAAENELLRAKGELRRTEGEAAAQQAMLDSLASAEVLELDVDRLAQSDLLTSKVLVPLQAELMKQMIAEPANEELAKKLADTEKRLAARREELREAVRQARSSEIKAAVDGATYQAAEWRKIVKAAEADVAACQAKLDALGRSSIDLNRMKGRLRELEAALNAIGTERERLKVELRSPSRITLIQRPEVSE